MLNAARRASAHSGPQTSGVISAHVRNNCAPTRILLQTTAPAIICWDHETPVQ